MRIEVDGLRLEVRPLALDLHGRVVLPGDHVGVRHYDPIPPHPSRALYPQTASSTEHPDHAAPGCTDLSIPGDPGVWRGHVRRRAVDGWERIEAREGVEQRPARRQRAVERLKDRGALNVAPEVTRSGRLERNRSSHPYEAEPEAGHEHGAGGAVDRAESRPH